MMKFAIFGLFVFLSLCCVLQISLSQVNTPTLSPEQNEVVKPLRKLVEGWDKKDMGLFISAYDEKAIIEMMDKKRINKDKFKETLKLGGVPFSCDVEKVEIKGEKAVIESITKFGNSIILRKFDLVKKGDSWLIIGQWLR